MSEAATANMEGFIDYLMMVLPAIRVDTFVERVRQSVGAGALSDERAKETEFNLHYPSKGLRARAVLKEGEFIVLAGSQARASWEGQEGTAITYEKLHNELIASGILKPAGEHAKFSQNYAFTSPSAAAAVIYGRSASGPMSWKTPTGQFFKDWEAEQLTDDGEQIALAKPVSQEPN
ncbi:DUF4357 domain-containing protein [Qipengyuania flava]|uniref:DUF4357 domain-containing protein n=1 Tax=Qipengyuania flava TaxID=192812 RepID=UPI001CD371C2|nr:DUF4357 domain-containing protein [Qipengyuania flava]MCA0891804.1 DUF4357 domain-containing protein [Qipengyuania flava]